MCGEIPFGQTGFTLQEEEVHALDGLMLFSLIHNPCSTTIYTIYKETGSPKWTAVAALMPVALGFVVTFLVAIVWRTLSG